MASLIYGNKLPLLQKGFRSRINDSEIVGKTILSTQTDDMKFGDVLFVAGEGLVKKDGSASDSVFAGILCGTNVKMPERYPAEADIVSKPGEAVNCLVRGSIAVACSDTAVAAGKPAKVTRATGAIATTGDIEIGVFTGVKEGGLVEVFVRR